MWLISQNKSKLINLTEIQYITLSKSYGSKDKDGNHLKSAIVVQFSPNTSTNVVSIGLYKNDEEAISVIEKIYTFIDNDEGKVFHMP